MNQTDIEAGASCRRPDGCVCEHLTIRLRAVLAATDGYLASKAGTDAYHKLNAARAEARALLQQVDAA